VLEKRLGYQEIAFFFFPLLLNVQLMSISHTFINGALVRLDDFVTALAGISVAMVVRLFISSSSHQNHTIAIIMARGRKSIIRCSDLYLPRCGLCRGHVVFDFF